MFTFLANCSESRPLPHHGEEDPGGGTEWKEGILLRHLRPDNEEAQERAALGCNKCKVMLFVKELYERDKTLSRIA